MTLAPEPTPPPSLTIIESPFAGPARNINILYARLCCRDSIERGEVPFASHLFFTQFLSDDDKAERDLGIKAGLVLHQYAIRSVAYVDLGVSSGMILGRDHASAEGVTIATQRRLFPNLDHTKPADLEKLHLTIVKKSLTLPPDCVT